MASVLAMIYLVLFAALALGFYAQTNMAAHVSNNEVVAARSMSAAESGMAFMRYQFSRVELKHFPEDQMLTEVAYELLRLMDGTGNLANGLQEVGMSDDGTAILIPNDQTAVIPLGNGTGFRCKITRDGRKLVVKVVGRPVTGQHAGAVGTGRGVEYTFVPVQRDAPLLEAGVAGRGQVFIDGKGKIQSLVDPKFGSVMTVTTKNPAVTMSGEGLISGQVFYTNPAATFSYSNNSSIYGGTSAAHKTANTIYREKPAGLEHYDEWPEFPTIDTSVYTGYLRRTWTPLTGLTLRNIRIPANSGTSLLPLEFGAGTTIEGVCYVEAPNYVVFEGGCTIRGVIVGPNAPAGTLAENVVEFKGQATAYDMSTLSSVYDMSVTANAEEFPPGLLALTGASILNPGFHVKFSGGYAAISGTIVSDQLSFTGSAGGDITGYVIGLADQTLYIGGSGTIQVAKPGTSMWPAGVYFRQKFEPAQGTYREFHPSSAAM